MTELQQVKILDPACGSGNFLYVTLDLLKGLESEVLRRLEDVTGSAQLRLDIAQVNPSQFLGIELNPRAAAIADLVIWIGYLQWHFRRFGDIPPIEPVLREYNNIECRDAVLAYDAIEPDVDAAGKVRTRWGGRMMKSPVTGEDIPDPTDKVTIWKYVNPQQAEWPAASYITGNPPFVGNKRMKTILGDGYVQALRRAWKEVPNSADFVMYWWEKGAQLVKQGNLESFGLITTNSITQSFNKKVLESHIEVDAKGSLLFAVADHPWVDSEDGAQVRVAMTVFSSKNCLGRLLTLTQEVAGHEEEQCLELKEKVGKINPDLSIGVNLGQLKSLLSNTGLACPGLQLSGQGFVISSEELNLFSEKAQSKFIKKYITGRDLTQISRKQFVIDTFGLSESELRSEMPDIYQWLLNKVKPERDQSSQAEYAKNWWLHSKPRPVFRQTFQGLTRFVVTSRTARHRVFQFLSTDYLPETKVLIFSLNDGFQIGVLSSRLHIIFANANGGWLGVGNDSTYNHSNCFNPFPFPDPIDTQKQTIRELGERLDSHRKRVQATHPEVTITAMYNLLEKLRKAEPLDDKDKAFNQKALVSTLKQIHDELDSAVFAAYGWEPTLTDDQILENLVTLNAQRAEEERNGLIRWLRPDYQAPGETYVQPSLAGITTETEIAIAPTEQQPFPKTLKEQLSAIRDLFRTQSGEWTAAQVTAHFKGANRKQKVILDCLESLEDLGILLSHTENGMTFWHLAEVGNIT